MAQIHSYFETVPDEIKVKIFCYLKTTDIISVCKAFPQLIYISCDPQILRLNGLNFYKSYQMTVQDLKKLFSCKVELANVTTLNISGLYWIPASDLVNFIKKLPNLVNLFAVGTKLGFSTLPNCELTKIKKVAVTNKSAAKQFFNYEVISRCSNTLEFVLMHMERTKSTRFMLTVNHILFCITGDFINANHYMHVLSHEKNKKDDVNYPKLAKCSPEMFFTFATEFNETPNVKWSLKDYLLLLENNCPFGIRDIKTITNKNCDVNAILLAELNLCHKSLIKNDEPYKCFVAQIVSHDNIKFLKKLALNFCSCKGSDYSLPKKRKLEDVGDDFDTKNVSVLEKIVDNCPYLEELEIWKCDCHTESNNQSNLNNIPKLKRLKKLTLINVPLNIPNKLLLNVIKNCEQLEHLNVKSDKLNATLNNSMYSSLPHAAALKDLRYEQTYVSLDRVFESLNKIEDCQLQRLHIKCRKIEKFQVKNFEKFLQRCKHLVFLLLEIESLPQNIHKNIQKTLDEYSKNPQQVFYSTRFAASKNIPAVHLLELVEIRKKVSVLNFFESCDSFV